MTPNSKILSVALAAAVLGGSTVALVNHSGNIKQAETAPAATLTTQPVASAQAATDTNLPASNLTTTTQPQASTDSQIATNASNAKEDQGGYREGYTQGLQDANGLSNTTTRSTVSQRTTEVPARVVTRTRYVNNTPHYRNNTATERRAYYDYSQPRQRSFWQKHRDKLTVGGGTVGGALLGGIIGGKKGAAIGALSGAGGSALYTYKIRNKKRHY